MIQNKRKQQRREIKHIIIAYIIILVLYFIRLNILSNSKSKKFALKV